MRARRRKGDRITGPDAAALLAADPDSVGWLVSEFAEQFCLSSGEMLAELRSGRLQAHQPEDPVILGSSAIAWLENPAVDDWLKVRWRVRDAVQAGIVKTGVAVIGQDDEPVVVPHTLLARASGACVEYLMGLKPRVQDWPEMRRFMAVLSEEADRAGDAKLAGLLLRPDALLLLNERDLEAAGLTS